MNRKQVLPGLFPERGFFGTEPLRADTLRNEPDWVLVERITGKKCPETVSLRSLSRMTESELVRTLGLSDSQGKKLSAALTLAGRLAHEGIERGSEINTAQDVYRVFAGRLRDAKKESFYAVTLDQKHKVIDIHRISEGTLTMTPVHPREAFNPVLRDHAASVIFVHNHPSGDPEPSALDRDLTRRLLECGDLLSIRVLDHLVVGSEGHYSFRDHEGMGSEYGSRAAEAGREKPSVSGRNEPGRTGGEGFDRRPEPRPSAAMEKPPRQIRDRFRDDGRGR